MEGCRLFDMRRVRDHPQSRLAGAACGELFQRDRPGAQHNNRVPAQLRCRASTTFARRWRTTPAPRRSAHFRANLRALLPAEKKGARALP